MDVFSRGKRSQIMSRISGKDTKPEKFGLENAGALGLRDKKSRRIEGQADLFYGNEET